MTLLVRSQSIATKLGKDDIFARNLARKMLRHSSIACNSLELWAKTISRMRTGIAFPEICDAVYLAFSE